MAGPALKTLIIIAPDLALPIFYSYLQQGKPGVDIALAALASRMPDKALPIILDRLQSPDLKIRRQSLSLLRHYPSTPQIDSAMQAVAAGSDSRLALSAKNWLSDQYEADHPESSLFPGEPSYGGKRLGDWLKMKDLNTGDFTPAARDAIQNLGTNAIPALLQRLTYSRPPYCFPKMDININAASGFIALGEKATPALPQLLNLMDSSNEPVALAAMIASCGTGSNAMPFLIKGLSNQFPNVRNEAASLLTDSIGAQFPQQRKQAVPYFVKLLDDPDKDVRMNATNQLKEIDSLAAARAGIK